MTKPFTVAAALLLCPVMLAGQNKAGADQQMNPTPPSVAAAAVPLYPPLARMARIEGTVHVKVTTDGHKVVATEPEDGHKMLTAAAESNAKTWEFAAHKPTTFIITYHYKLVAESRENRYGPTVILRLPTEVEVIATPIALSDPSPDPSPQKKQQSEGSPSHESGHATGAGGWPTQRSVRCVGLLKLNSCNP